MAIDFGDQRIGLAVSDLLGMLAGEAYGTTNANVVLCYGHVDGIASVGGVFGTTGEHVHAVDCYSTAVVTGGQSVGGIIGSGDGSITTSVFTGMVSPGTGGSKHGLTGGNGIITNSYFD